MDGKERRRRLLELLQEKAEPVTGTVLARCLKVSRQVVVGDIAILRAAGVSIYATPQGYIIPAEKPSGVVRAEIACRHDRAAMEDELATIIDNGGKVIDVIVEHPVYGDIKANLMLSSRRDLKEFLHKLRDAEPLSLVTGGVHLHTVEAPSNAVLERIKEELKMKQILLK